MVLFQIQKLEPAPISEGDVEKHWFLLESSLILQLHIASSVESRALLGQNLQKVPRALPGSSRPKNHGLRLRASGGAPGHRCASIP